MLSEKELLNILDNKEKVNVEFKEAKEEYLKVYMKLILLLPIPMAA